MESALFRGDPTRKIRVVCQSSDSPHNVASVEALAARLCSLTGRHLLPTLQSFDENNGTFFVPTFALVRQDGHPEMSIENFYGGIIHHGFMATKLVTHPHWHDDDNLPEGWAGNFAAWLQDCVLPGFSVFSHGHALDAAGTLLKKHKVRFKNPYASGGKDQIVIETVRALDGFLETVSDREIANGLVIEEHVENSTTYSVGLVQIENHIGSYLGRQYTSQDNDGSAVYAGSRLRMVRGGWDALLRQLHSPVAHRIVENARRYDEAARQHLGLVASRRNYDVLVGPITENGVRCGVLEQSWRVGGASPAEILAMEKLMQDESITAVQAFLRESREQAPTFRDDDFIVYSGEDDFGQPLHKYARIEKIYHDP
ncbi:DUF3182 family protein [Brucella pituitosa]|uniref:DUF3182 family protein n=1 Tax=Brucella pituitosa TaxID=571256 RepID=UPI003F4ADCCF